MRWRSVGEIPHVSVWEVNVGVLMMFGGFMRGWLRIGGVMMPYFGKYRSVR